MLETLIPDPSPNAKSAPGEGRNSLLVAQLPSPGALLREGAYNEKFPC
jgi:hypothetical protein